MPRQKPPQSAPSRPKPPQSAPSRASKTTPRRRQKKREATGRSPKTKVEDEAPVKQVKKGLQPNWQSKSSKLNIGSVVLPNDPVIVPEPQRSVLKRGALQSGAPFYSPYASASLGATSKQKRRQKLRQRRRRRERIKCSTSLGWPSSDDRLSNNGTFTSTSGMNNLVGRRVGTAPAGARRKPAPTKKNHQDSSDERNHRSSNESMQEQTAIKTDGSVQGVSAMQEETTKREESLGSASVRSIDADYSIDATDTYTLHDMYDDDNIENADKTPESTYQGTYAGSPNAHVFENDDEEEIGVPFGSPRLNLDFASQNRIRKNVKNAKLERDADLFTTQAMNETVFFHSTGLQSQAVASFTAEAVKRAERRARFLSQLEDRMVKAVESDYNRMQKRVQVLKDQRDMRRALEKAYREEDQWISDLRERRRNDRMVHKKAANDTEAKRRSDAAAYAEQQKRNKAYIEKCKADEVAQNQATRRKILREREIGIARAVAYKNKKLEDIRNEKRSEAKKKRAQVTRRRRKIEKNLQHHKIQTERIQRLLEYRNMYNSEMARVYNDLSDEVREMRAKQRARNVFSAGQKPAHVRQRSGAE